MDMQSMVIFVLVGALCLFIVTGGMVAMTTESDPTPTTLVSGAAVGGLLGAAANLLSSGSLPDMVGTLPDMKVGLPSF